MLEQLESRGIGEDLNRIDAYKVPFSHVHNTVIKANPHFSNLPFSLKVGQYTESGLFIDSNATSRIYLEVWPGHSRSALLTSQIVFDDTNIPYHHVDIRGGGHIIVKNGRAIIEKPGLNHVNSREAWGFVNRDEAEHNYKTHEQFLEKKIRTSRIIGLLALEEIIVNGKKLTYNEAIAQSILPEGFEPTLEVRAFATKARVQDLAYSDQRTPFLLEQAKLIASTELGTDEIITDEAYIRWYAENLAIILGRIHRNGWVHSNLTKHNLTLDCRVVDLATVIQSENEHARERDVLFGQIAVKDLLRNIDQVRLREDEDYPTSVFAQIGSEEFQNSFMARYQEELQISQ